MHEDRKRLLISSLLSVITGWLSLGQRRVVLTLEGSRHLFRFNPRAGVESYVASLSQLLSQGERHWRYVGELASILGCDYLSLVDEFRAEESSLEGFSKAGGMTSYLACLAYLRGVLLCRQMGVTVGPTQLPSYAEVKRRSLACLDDCQQAGRSFKAVINSLVGSISAPQGLIGDAAMVTFAPREDSVELRWLNREGTEISRETLEEWVERLGSLVRLDFHLSQFQRLHPRQEAHRAAGDELLRTVCPDLARAVMHARANDCVTGFVLCKRAVNRGLPVQVWIYVNPGIQKLGWPTAHLVCIRSHKDFVLQNYMGSMFYFPPVQTVAQMEFAPAKNLWAMSRPRVRMPRGGTYRKSPYTGVLQQDFLIPQKTFPEDCSEVMVDASKAGRKVLPNSAQRYSGPVSNDLCLERQDHTVHQVNAAVLEAEERGQDPDLLTAMWSLWNIASLGLTKAHTRNRERPRVQLDQENMYYTVHSPKRLARSRLASRIYLYNP